MRLGGFWNEGWAVTPRGGAAGAPPGATTCGWRRNSTVVDGSGCSEPVGAQRICGCQRLQTKLDEPEKPFFKTVEAVKAAWRVRFPSASAE